MRATGRQPQWAPACAPIHYERHRPEQTTLYRLVQQHAATFFAETAAASRADLSHFIKDEFDAFLGCGIMVYGFLQGRRNRQRCGHADPALWLGRAYRTRAPRSAHASVSRSDERPPSLKVFWLRSPFRWCAQFLPVVRPKLAPEHLIISDSTPVDANREIVVDQ